MSVQSSEAFLRIAYKTPSVAQQLKATTGIQEIVRLGERHGYDFSINDFMEAASFFRPENAPPRPEPAPAPTSTTFLHHEYRLEDVPGFEPVIAELPQLKVQPPTVDLAQFHHSYRADDEATTSMSPADPTFQQWHAAMMKEGWQDPSRGHGGPRRDFHLINLDEHTEHPSYEAYFDAKTRTIAALENLFDSEIKFSGSMWYPPHSYRLWHTNETQPGWRMYVVDLDAPFEDPQETSFFRYMNPETSEIVTLREHPRIVRFFKAEQDPERLFWHCIVNPTERHRWSFGFVVPDDWQNHLQVRS
jgi:hypothetical protein